ncbi:MAG: hypothetical protein ACM3NR_03225 [Methanosarcina sp.]
MEENICEKITGIDTDILNLADHIYYHMVYAKLMKAQYNVRYLSLVYPFLAKWEYKEILILVNRRFNVQGKTGYLKHQKTIVIYMNSLCLGTLNHELMHVLQSVTDQNVLFSDYENNKVLKQLTKIFRKEKYHIVVLRKLLYLTDKREMGAFIHSLKKYDNTKIMELISYVILMKYFDVKNLMSDKNALNQFVTIWQRYYRGNIPFFERIALINEIKRNKLETKEIEINEFIHNINVSINNAANEYLVKIINQYSDNEADLKNLKILFDDVMRNLADTSFNDLMNMSTAENLRLSSSLEYDIKSVYYSQNIN